VYVCHSSRNALRLISPFALILFLVSTQPMQPPIPSPPQPPSPARRSPTPSSLPHRKTSLPSIHHLYLPPAAMSQHTLPPAEYPQPPVQFAQPVTASKHESETYGETEDAEELDQPGPPKKKRRRQALSCTGTLPSSCNPATLLTVGHFLPPNYSLLYVIRLLHDACHRL
jgi:hypothetical protein